MAKQAKSKKKNKTKTLMLAQTPEQNAQAGYDIESLLRNEMSSTMSFYLNKYGMNIERRLGLTKDDLENDAREQIWKGLLTYSPCGGANLKTYLNNLLRNRFNTLLERSRKKKNNMVDYYSDAWSTPGIDPEHTETDETPETIMAERETLINLSYQLNGLELAIHGDIMFGRNIAEMEKRHKASRVAISAAIQKILRLMELEKQNNER